MQLNQIIQGNTIEVMPTLPERFFHCCVTSPPYWGLRDYGLPPTDWPEVTYTPMPGLPPIMVPAWTDCLGLEPTPEMFVAHMVLVFREVWRVLRDDGTLWMNFGDSYFGTGGDRKDSTNGPNSCVGATADAAMPREGRAARHKLLAKSGLKPKDLIGIPWRVAFALQADGWYLRSDIIWSKPNPMPESVKDRPTKAHEYMFLLSKSERYYYDAEAIAESLTESSIERLTQPTLELQHISDRVPGKINGPMKAMMNKAYSFARKVNENGKPGAPNQHRADREEIEYRGRRNKRTIWTVATQPFKEAHFATFPPKLIEPCILAGSPQGGIVLDPFMGSGTTAIVSKNNGRHFIGTELILQYIIEEPAQEEAFCFTQK